VISHKPGEVFGRLTVTARGGKNAYNLWEWVCRCKCGREVIVSGNALRSGKTKSCGCLQKDVWNAIVTTHGMSRTPTWRTWVAMLTRCRNRNDHTYRNYGAKGVTVCRRWYRFESFLSDMGIRPPGTTIDRIDGCKGYMPGNCRWATPVTQNNNRTCNRRVSYLGRSMTISEWSRDTGIAYWVLSQRITKLGWSPDRAFTEPVHVHRRAS
jgi:hypothetical protein